MKATEQYFPVVLFIMLYKVVLTFQSVDEILWCDHSNETSLRERLYSTTFCLAFFKKRNVIIYLFIYLFFTITRNERVKREISVPVTRS